MIFEHIPLDSRAWGCDPLVLPFRRPCECGSTTGTDDGLGISRFRCSWSRPIINAVLTSQPGAYPDSEIRGNLRKNLLENWTLKKLDSLQQQKTLPSDMLSYPGASPWVRHWWERAYLSSATSSEWYTHIVFDGQLVPQSWGCTVAVVWTALEIRLARVTSRRRRFQCWSGKTGFDTFFLFASGYAYLCLISKQII